MSVKKHILIDGSHVVMTLRQINERRARLPKKAMDYGKLVASILGGKEIGEQSAVYLSEPPRGRDPYLAVSDQGQLESLGFDIHRSRLKEKGMTCHGCNRSWTSYQEKPVDAALIIGMFKAARQTEANDSIVVVSGDGDFFDAVWEISENWGVPIQVWGFKDHTSARYKEESRFDYQELDQFLVRATSRVGRSTSSRMRWHR